MLTAPLAKSEGGLGLCSDAEENPIFTTTDDPDYQAMRAALRKGAEALKANPRVDCVPYKDAP